MPFLKKTEIPSKKELKDPLTALLNYDDSD